jgi:hypothetical protein
MNAEKIEELEYTLLVGKRAFSSPHSVNIDADELLDIIATAKEVERLKAERDELVNVLAYYANGKDIYTGEHLGDYAAEAIVKVQK